MVEALVIGAFSPNEIILPPSVNLVSSYSQQSVIAPYILSKNLVLA